MADGQGELTETLDRVERREGILLDRVEKIEGVLRSVLSRVGFGQTAAPVQGPRGDPVNQCPRWGHRGRVRGTPLPPVAVRPQGGVTQTPPGGLGDRPGRLHGRAHIPGAGAVGTASKELGTRDPALPPHRGMPSASRFDLWSTGNSKFGGGRVLGNLLPPVPTQVLPGGQGQTDLLTPGQGQGHGPAHVPREVDQGYPRVVQAQQGVPPLWGSRHKW